MTDIKWIVEQHMMLYKEGKIDGKQAAAAICNAVLMSETDTINQYQYAKVGLECVCEGLPECKTILCKMIDGLIEDEGDHAASALKAQAALGGVKPPKPEEYDKAVKSDG